MESCIDMKGKKKSGARYCEEERRNLPVRVKKEEFVRTLKENKMAMVTGESSSGKTTQIPRSTREILRSKPVRIVLALKKMGVKDLTSFEYINPPSPEILLRGLEDLFYLGAVDHEGNLTNIGHMMGS